MSEPRPDMSDVIVQAAAPATHVRWRTAKPWWFAAVGAATLFMLWNNERFFLNPHAPEWVHYNPIRWQLTPHGFGGTIALLLGAVQFSTHPPTISLPSLSGHGGYLSSQTNDENEPRRQ